MAVVTLVLLVAALALAAPDWTDCPSPCRCKWSSGKKTAICKDAGFTGVPDQLDADMQVLDLSGNFIQTLGKDFFKAPGLINLQRIFLANAGVASVHRDAFKDLIILIEVDLSQNKITSLHPETFRGNERLRVLYLNGNPLRRIVQAQFPPLPHLRMLELDGCSLNAVHRNAFVHLGNLETLSLKNNLLQNLSEAVFMNFAHLKTLVLEGNPWRCDCELRGFRDWFLLSKLHSVSLTCAEPERLVDRLWENVPADEFACPPQVMVNQRQVQAEAGGNVTFGCHVTGDPEPQVSWLYESYPINHTWLVIEAEEGLLDKWANISVYNVSEADTGVYTCIAKNVLDTVSLNVTLVLPEVVTATTVSKSEVNMVWWALVIVCVTVACAAASTTLAVCCVRNRSRRHRRSNMKASVSFNDQEKKLLDVSIATTTDRGTGSCEALSPHQDMVDPPVHITIESEPLPMAVFPAPPPEFSTGLLPAAAYGNIFISVSVSRDPTDTRCPDLLDLPHRPKYHGMATLPRRPPCAIPHYDNMGPRVTAGGSSTLSLPGSADHLAVPPPPPPPSCVVVPQLAATTSEFVSL